MRRILPRGAKLVLASHNAGKLREILELLAPHGIDVVSAGSLGLPEPAETAPDFEGNARLKALAASTATGLAALADDSGFCVAALDGAPGVLSARWAGPDKDFAAAMAQVHTRMGGTADRRAWFVSALCLAWPDGRTDSFTGRIDGQVRLAAARHARLRLRPDLRARRRNRELWRDGAVPQARHQPPRPRLRAVHGRMPRLIPLLLALALIAAAPAAPSLHPSAAFVPLGPERAAGILVWLHGGYDSDVEPDGPPEPGWVARMAERHYDIWRFDRPPGQDRLDASGAALVASLQRLRADGYRRVVVAGQSRGAFVALGALAHPELVDAIAAISPAAHGTNPARRPQAMADFMARLNDAAGPMRFAMVQLADDPFDPDPDARTAAVRAAAARAGISLLLIDRPSAPVGHMGSYEPAFDTLFGACLAEFLTGAASTMSCPG